MTHNKDNTFNLKEGMLVEFRNAQIAVVLGDDLFYSTGRMCMWEFDEDLKMEDSTHSEYDIMKVGMAGKDTRSLNDLEIGEVLWERVEFKYPMYFKPVVHHDEK